MRNNRSWTVTTSGILSFDDTAYTSLLMTCSWLRPAGNASCPGIGSSKAGSLISAQAQGHPLMVEFPSWRQVDIRRSCILLQTCELQTRCMLHEVATPSESPNFLLMLHLTARQTGRAFMASAGFASLLSLSFQRGLTRLKSIARVFNSGLLKSTPRLVIWEMRVKELEAGGYSHK